MEDDNKAIEAVDVNGENDDDENFADDDDVRTPEPIAADDTSHPHTGDGASPGKIFIGGLARETTPTQFLKHFGKYGEITDSVIMKDRMTGAPRGFGFVTYADATVVDKVIEDTHIINGKQVEIKRTIPRGAAGGGSKDFKTKKVFVGGIPTSVTEDELKIFFSKFGEVKEHIIMRDHSTGRSRGFGFVTFEMEQAVDDLLSNGNRIEFAGVQVEIKKAEPKKPNPPPPASSKRRGNPNASFGGGYGDAYGGYGGVRSGAGAGAGSYRSGGAYGARGGAYGSYGGGGGDNFGGYGGYGSSSFGGYRGEPAASGYSSRYSGGYGRGYDMGSGGSYGGLGESYGAYGGGTGTADGYGGGGFDAGYGRGSYGGSGGEGSFYGSRGGYGGGGAGGGRGRYHPYGRA